MSRNELRLLVGMTGSIGVLSLIPQLRMWQGSICTQMQVILSRGAEQFVTASAVRAAAGCPVHTAEIGLGPGQTKPAHVALGEWCDAIVIAPASANTIAALAQGRADSLLTLCALGLTKPRVVIPNMNDQMWRAPAVRRNVVMLAEDGWHVLGVDADGPGSVSVPRNTLSAPTPEALAGYIAVALGLA